MSTCCVCAPREKRQLCIQLIYKIYNDDKQKQKKRHSMSTIIYVNHILFLVAWMLYHFPYELIIPLKQ